MDDSYTIDHQKIRKLIKKRNRSKAVSIDDLVALEQSQHQALIDTSQAYGPDRGFTLLDEDEVSEFDDQLFRQVKSNSTPNEISIQSLNFDDNYFMYPRPDLKPFSLSGLALQAGCVALFIRFAPQTVFLTDLLTLDGVFSSLLFILSYYKISGRNFFYQEQLSVRYFYYILTVIAYYQITGSLWIDTSKSMMNLLLPQLIVTVVGLPFITNRVCQSRAFQVTYQFVRRECLFLLKYLVSKKLTGLINRIGIEYLETHPHLKAEELVNSIDKISFKHLLSFLGSCLLASLLAYLESDGVKFYTIIFRQYYFKQYLREDARLNDVTYVSKMIEDRDWERLVDPYTLNRLMRLYLQINETANGGLLKNNGNTLELARESLQRFTANWTVYSLLQYRSSGIWTYAIYIWRDLRRPDRKYLPIRLAIICLFVVLSLLSNEQVLFLLLLEVATLLVANRIFTGIIKDLKKIITRELRYYLLIPENLNVLKRYYAVYSLYWPAYWYLYTYHYHWEVAIIAIVGWMAFQAKCFYHTLSQLLLMVALNACSVISGGHPVHLMFLNFNMDAWRAIESRKWGERNAIPP